MKEKYIKDLTQMCQRRAGNQVEQLERYRRMYASANTIGGDAGSQEPRINFNNLDGGTQAQNVPVMDTNYTYAFVDSFSSAITPTNPQMTINVNSAEHLQFAKAREQYINKFYIEQNFAANALTLSTKSALEGHAFLCWSWDAEKKQPTVEVVSRRYVWFDYLARDWAHISFLVRVHELTEDVVNTWKKLGIIKSDTKLSYIRTPDWLRGRNADIKDDISNVIRKAIVFEFFDFTENRVFYLNDTYRVIGSSALPYEHVRNPYIMCQFLNNALDLESIPMLQIIDAPLARLNEYDNLELWFVLANIPKCVINVEACVDGEDFISAYNQTRSPNQAIPAKFKNGAGIDDVISYSKTPSLTPDFRRAREKAEQSIQLSLGMALYERGIVGQTDIATEVALANEAIRTRATKPINIMLTVINESTRYIYGLYREFGKNDDTFVAYNDKYKASIDYTKLFPEGFDERSFMYTAIAYNATANSKSVLLSNIAKFLQLLTTSTFVDQAKLMERFLDALGIGELFILPTPQALAPGAQPEGVPDPTKAAGGGDPNAVAGLLDSLGMGNISQGEMPAPEPAQNTAQMASGGPGNGYAAP